MAKVTHPPYNYDKEFNTLTCFSYRDFLETINTFKTKGEDIETNESCFLASSWGVISVTGKYKNYYNWYTMYPALEEDFGISVDIFKSFYSAGLFTLKLTKPLIENVTPVVEEEAPSLEEVILETQKDLEEAIQSLEDLDIDSILDELRDIYDEDNVKESKDELEKVVIERFNIDLKKNKSFDNMLLQLKEELLSV